MSKCTNLTVLCWLITVPVVAQPYYRISVSPIFDSAVLPACGSQSHDSIVYDSATESLMRCNGSWSTIGGQEGPQGEQGIQGEQGVQGPAGPSSGLEVVFISSAGTNEIWTNQPAAQTELMGSSANRKQVDLANFTQFRIIVGQAVNGATGAILRAMYSTNGAVWTALESALGVSADLNIGSGTGLRVGVWGVIDVPARGDVQLRIDGLLGNGTADPAFRQLSVQFK